MRCVTVREFVSRNCRGRACHSPICPPARRRDGRASVPPTLPPKEKGRASPPLRCKSGIVNVSAGTISLKLKDIPVSFLKYRLSIFVSRRESGIEQVTLPAISFIFNDIAASFASRERCFSCHLELAAFRSSCESRIVPQLNPSIFFKNRAFFRCKPLEFSRLSSMGSFSSRITYPSESIEVNLNGFVWVRFFLEYAVRR